MTVNNKTYLNRKGKIFVENRDMEKRLSEVALVATLDINLRSLGYRMSHELVTTMLTLEKMEILEIGYQLTIDIAEMVGNVRYKPLYPNYPVQLMEFGTAVEYIEATKHHSLKEEVPSSYNQKEREALEGWYKLKVIELGSIEDYLKIVWDLIQSKTSISDADKEFILDFAFENNDLFVTIMNDSEIPHKENVAFMSKIILDTTGSLDAIRHNIKTATDLLRLITALSEGDISLQENTVFRKFKRSYRRMFLELLDNMPSIEEDMNRYAGEWIRIGEILHPGEYKSRYPFAHTAFDKIRNNVHINTFGGMVSKSFEYGKIDDILHLLSSRPGEFVRKLDYTLREFPEHSDLILESLEEVISEVSVPVLLQAYAHFEHRSTDPIRSFFPKGNTSKVYSIENTVTPIEDVIVGDAIDVIAAALLMNFSTRPSLGKVYIEDSLVNYKVPQSQRSASKSLRTLTRGSRVPLPDNTNIIRTFVHWTEPRDARTDIDLSVVVFNKDWGRVLEVYYGNINENIKDGFVHSGDVQSAPEGASEFIDIDVTKSIALGGRYIAVSIKNYTDQPFNTLPECFAGWMSRHDGQSGEIFDARTVIDKFDVTSDANSTIPMIFDLMTREMVWLDVTLNTNDNHVNNVIGNSTSIGMVVQAIVKANKPNLFDLFTLHAQARGEIVTSREEADTIFSVDEGITPYELDVISSQYL